MVRVAAAGMAVVLHALKLQTVLASQWCIKVKRCCPPCTQANGHQTASMHVSTATRGWSRPPASEAAVRSLPPPPTHPASMLSQVPCHHARCLCHRHTGGC